MFNPYRHTQDLDKPFSFNRLYRHPGDLSRHDPGGKRQRIAIIGGGIAGLVSAYELSHLKHHVTLLEADSRLGGRIKTHYFSDGTYGELGAMRIPSSHQCVMHYINDFSLKIQRFTICGVKRLDWMPMMHFSPVIMCRLKNGEIPA